MHFGTGTSEVRKQKSYQFPTLEIQIFYHQKELSLTFLSCHIVPITNLDININIIYVDRKKIMVDN